MIGIVKCSKKYLKKNNDLRKLELRKVNIPLKERLN